ncbi:hypothetical protein TD95_000874 [Thielaviopsis punctulata]|uniref:PWWP domain-containing protein n=1 Tax=Thielaviopsis punctulata TaxID=72032 RepID=A0A0F4Z9D9_9PEZI|nr:hypothetical protein TD95_000874 [Thielaviopsis punctulata]
MPSPAKTPEKEEPSAVVEDKTTDVSMTEAEEKTKDTPAESENANDDKPESEEKDTEMKEAANDAAAADDKEPTKAPPKKKASGAATSGGKKKKGTRTARYLDAKPGDQFLVKLKGFPAWPAIIADEDMLPTRLLSTRPVTAKRADGTYREDYADGGKRMNDRTFPVMYLYTNEFGWAPNSMLSELTAEKARETKTDKLRKDLQAAYELAADAHPIEYYKNVLQEFQEELVAAEEAAKEEAEKKAKASLEVPDDDAPKKTKKRKADEDVSRFVMNPTCCRHMLTLFFQQARANLKKPKIKLNVSNPKSNGDKAKTNKPKPAAKKVAIHKEPAMTPQQRLEHTEKQVRFFRHKLQKCLLTHDVEPTADDMPMMNEYLSKLESMIDMDVSIIRATKINKVMKAILKLESIPRDSEFKFKSRAANLLVEWNKQLAADSAASGAAGTAEKAGANGKTEGEATTVADRTKPAAADEEASQKKTEETVS